MNNLFAATYAPMKLDLSINPEVVPGYADYLKRNQIYGVFINGSTGDFVSLTLDERKTVMEAWAQEKKSGLKVINHVGSNSLKEAELLAQHSVGRADAIAAIAPFYFKPGSLEQLLDYCIAISEKAEDLPFYYYHLPVLTGVNFSMALFAEKAKERIPNFAGIKFTENNLVEFQKTNLTHPDLNIFFGVDEAFYSSLGLEAQGWVGSTYNHLGPLFLEIRAAFERGDVKEAAHLQSFVVGFVETLSSFGSFNGSGKSFMKKLGVDCGPSRYPHPTLNDLELNKAFEKFRKSGLSEYLSS